MSQKWDYVPLQQQKKAISIMQIGKQILSVWAEISFDLLPILENTSKRDINMETDFHGLFFVPCEVARKTELISTALLWVCFKEKK